MKVGVQVHVRGVKAVRRGTTGSGKLWGRWAACCVDALKSER